MRIERVDPGDRALVEQCARMMIATEPWITLRRTLDGALRTLGDPAKELYAASEGDQLAGSILLDLRGPLAGYIQSVCVRADSRGRGVGKALVSWAEERIYRESPNVFLFVSSFNGDALRFYERLGFEVVGRVPGFIVPEHDEILMRKTLGPWSGSHADDS